MSESENLDLSARDLMASWVSDLEKPSARYRDHDPDTDKPKKKSGRFQDRKGGYRGGDRDNRRGGGDRDNRGGGGGGGGGNRRDYGRGKDRDRDRRGGRDRDRDRRGGRGFRDRDRDERDRPKTVDPTPPLEVSLFPAPSSIDALAKHIRSTGRAYPMADVAKMVLGGRDRYQIKFQLKNPEKDSLFLCNADESLWISKEEAIQHLLNSPALQQYYDIEEVEIDPPRGHFAVVAVCGMSGHILGPPNHHEYQRNLNRLHRERFSHMSLERYKSRVDMKRDEETIEKWKEQVSKAFHYRLRTADTESSDPEPEAEEATEAVDAESPAKEETPIEAASETDSEPAAETSESAETDALPPEPVETELSDPEKEENEEAAPDEAPTEEDSEANSAEPAESGSDEAETESDAEGEAPEEETKAESICLESREELARHFRANFADEVIQSIPEATVPGDIPGKNLSRGLLNRLKSEAEKQRRGFPLALIQLLCGEFEKRGLRFFKRGKKTLFVSVARPRPIKNEEAFTERLRQIVDYVRSNPRKKVVDLLNALVTDYKKPEKSESFQEHHLTQAEHDVLADLRWLTMEGYLIEYPDTQLMLGRTDPQPPSRSKAKKKAAAKQPKKQGAAPSGASKPAPAETGVAASGADSPTAEKSGEDAPAPAPPSSKAADDGEKREEAVEPVPVDSAEEKTVEPEVPESPAVEDESPPTPEPETSPEPEKSPEKAIEDAPAEEETIPAENKSGEDVPSDAPPSSEGADDGEKSEEPAEPVPVDSAEEKAVEPEVPESPAVEDEPPPAPKPEASPEPEKSPEEVIEDAPAEEETIPAENKSGEDAPAESLTQESEAKEKSE